MVCILLQKMNITNMGRNNINGGCLSYKIEYENLSDKFKNILLLCLSIIYIKINGK